MPWLPRARQRRRRDYRTELRVQVLSGTTSADSRGHSQETYKTVDRLWAAVRQLRGDEAIVAREQFGVATHEVEHDYNDHVTQTARYIVAESTARVLNVVTVDDVDGRRRTQRVTVREEI